MLERSPVHVRRRHASRVFWSAFTPGIRKRLKSPLTWDLLALNANKTHVSYLFATSKCVVFNQLDAATNFSVSSTANLNSNESTQYTERRGLYPSGSCKLSCDAIGVGLFTRVHGAGDTFPYTCGYQTVGRVPQVGRRGIAGGARGGQCGELHILQKCL